MKTFDLFVVKLEKKLNDSITTESGLELYIDTRFNEFENRTTVEVGDTLYFHHLVVVNDGQPLTGEDDHYVVRYDPNHTINNQAIAYKSAKTGRLHPLAGWSLLERVEEKQEEESGVLDVIRLKEKPVTKGVVSFKAAWLEELGVKPGDVVGFKENRDYRIKIDGKEYYRTRSEDLMYVER